MLRLPERRGEVAGNGLVARDEIARLRGRFEAAGDEPAREQSDRQRVVLGRRAALRILWELRADPLTFRELLAAAATNPGVLNTRLAELRDASVVEATEAGYALTRDGRVLIEGLTPLDAWAKRWAKRV